MGESYVVKSKLREFAKGKDMNVSAEADEALSDAVENLLEKAVERAEANSRKTIKARDI